MSRQTIAERISSKVERCGDCLVWTGYKDPKGYGRLRINGSWQRAHRLNYTLHHGDIPAGAVIRHTCDNPACVEPAHLVIGSQADNVRDMFARKRANKASGERHHSAKLSTEQVAEIRRLYKPRTYGHGAHVLAKRFGVSKAVIYAILKGLAWRTTTADFPPADLTKTFRRSLTKEIHA